MATKTTEKPRLPFVGEGRHSADERRYDPLAKQSWCVCGQFHWPHDLVKHRPTGDRHLECLALGPDGVSCTITVGQHSNDRPTIHNARVGNPVTGWGAVTWQERPRSQSKSEIAEANAEEKRRYLAEIRV